MKQIKVLQNAGVNRYGRMPFLVAIGVAVLASACAGTDVDNQSSEIAIEQSACLGSKWVGTWSASPMPGLAVFGSPKLSFENQTLRQITHVSLGGNEVRVRISNAYGSAPLTIGAAHVALQDAAASIVPSSDRVVAFSGRSSVTIPPGEVVLSDSIRLRVPDLSNLALSLFVPDAVSSVTWHDTGLQTTYISPPGNFVSAADMPTEETAASYYWISGVEVRASRDDSAVVAFGDSITDGMGSTVDANRRWPDQLSQRLDARVGRRFGRIGVLNQGISGNRLLRDFMGPNALGRFETDVLDQSGAKYVVVMIGINDIGAPGVWAGPEDKVTAPEIISGLGDLITRAHARGLRVYGGTLTPCEPSAYYTPENEAMRQAVNDWIRTGGSFDAVIDFDATLRDPSRPTQLRPEYDSGDHLHPGDAGYEAMANAVDLSLFRR